MGAYDCDCINNLEYDRRERKAQLSKEGTTKGATSDMISRMETVEHLRRVLDATVPITDYDEGYVDGIEFGISTVSTMPPAQSQSTAGQLNDSARSTARSTDLIDRQAAIDAIVQCTNCGDEDTLREYVLKHSLDNGWTGGILEALDAVKDLPTAQPEPHEGHWINGKCDRCGEHAPFWCMASTYHESNYCPNCGAKMTISK